jgi:YfiH family protein
MLRKRKGAVEWLEFELLQGVSGLVHAVFTRRGGVSKGPWASLNLSASTGDDPSCVAQNLQLIQEILGLPIASGKQCHGVVIADVEREGCAGTCDGLLTGTEGVALLVKHADCQAALFVDPARRLLANVHAGWRGNVQNIYAQTVQRLIERGARAEELLVGISPSLGPEAAEFLHYRDAFPEALWRFQTTPYHFDLWGVARAQLEACGILPHHIEIASLCTYSNPEDFFSHRRDPRSGRNGTAAGFRKSTTVQSGRC